MAHAPPRFSFTAPTCCCQKGPLPMVPLNCCRSVLCSLIGHGLDFAYCCCCCPQASPRTAAAVMLQNLTLFSRAQHSAVRDGVLVCCRVQPAAGVFVQNADSVNRLTTRYQRSSFSSFRRLLSRLAARVAVLRRSFLVKDTPQHDAVKFSSTAWRSQKGNKNLQRLKKGFPIKTCSGIGTTLHCIFWSLRFPVTATGRN